MRRVKLYHPKATKPIEVFADDVEGMARKGWKPKKPKTKGVKKDG